MSSSFRNPMRVRDAVAQALRQTVLVGAALVAVPALGAQVYTQPIVSVAAHTSSNVDLSTTDRQSTEGLAADAATVVGIATPRSDTTLKPRLIYRYYPDDSELNRLEAFLDLTTLYTGPRSIFRMFGRYEHRDQLNAERSAARFDELEPTSPTAPDTTPETGRIRAGSTRDMFLLAPTYSYKLTQRTSLGTSATLQTLDYSPDDATSHVDFNYYQANGFGTWALNERSDLSVGAYASKYDAQNIDSESNSYGTSVDLDYNWTKVFETTIKVVYQRTDIDRTEPRVYEDTVNAWGASVGSTYRGQANRLRFTLGRNITPSGSGGLEESDNVRVQYEQDLSERLELTFAGRYLQNSALTNDVAGNDRDYTRANVALKWMLAPTWFIEGSYEYTWQDYANDPGTASDHQFEIRFGYQGLPRQR